MDLRGCRIQFDAGLTTGRIAQIARPFLFGKVSAHARTGIFDQTLRMDRESQEPNAFVADSDFEKSSC
jgi:hypothetical protein